MKKLLLVLLVATPALAQDVEPEPTKQRVKFKERTELDFDAVRVDGTVTRPELTPVDGLTALDDFTILFRVRTDFSVEMSQSVDAVK
ncbi:MAG: hypothetical protein H6737_08965 [Alphaproteobacteria bacterium]|nr:hypothetical protein [Alphaproteobacteria bacterium]